MKFVLDLVHHNPGEPPFKTAFSDPAHLADYGYNGQVLKHINCVATFAATGVDFFPMGSPDQKWLFNATQRIEQEIALAKKAGLMVFHHIDLFVLPKRLVECFGDDICDPKTGRISLSRPKTMELHKILFDELTARFPQVDGFIVRVGETYLYDTPFHVGNGPIPPGGEAWWPEYGYKALLRGQAGIPAWSDTQTEAYVELINFLRETICERHGKFLIFRTWDIFPDKLHARRDHYLRVASRVVTHEKLFFSIKHTALDFWRRVKVNPCLGIGSHAQIIEVQSQREYEGKGAYPNYVMDGVINGFEENANPIGLKDLFANPMVKGVFDWSRGGGWYGPYIPCELWPDLNAFVLGQFAKNPARPEREIFHEYATRRLNLSHADAWKLRELCLLSSKAILKGRYCEAFDRILAEAVLPTANWMRDDRLGGRRQLNLVFQYLFEENLLPEALSEKAGAVKLWQEVEQLAREIDWPDDNRGEFARSSCEYGRLLFAAIHEGWRILAAGFVGDRTGCYDGRIIGEAAVNYANHWRSYRVHCASALSATPYQGSCFSLPGSPPVAGLDESVEYYKQKIRTETDAPTLARKPATSTTRLELNGSRG